MIPTQGKAPYDLLPPNERDYFDSLGPGLVVVLPPQRPKGGWGSGGPPHGGAWIHIGPDGIAHAFTGKVEVGQGTRTALSLLVAEELRVPLTSVKLTMGDTDICPWDMGTFGSRSMPDAGQHLRTTSAAARTFLAELAAAKLEIAPEEVELMDGLARIKGEKASRSVGIGELVKGLRRLELVPSSTQPTPALEWKVAGRATVNLGGHEIVTGARKYTSDLSLEGMLRGKILFPPVYGAKLLSVDISRAKALPGVVVVHEGTFVGVAAPTLPAAIGALNAVKAEWETSPQPSEFNIVEHLRQHPAEGEDFWDVDKFDQGDVEEALRSATFSLHENYTAAYVAHVPMETHAVLASWDGDRVTVWVGAQTPFRAREAISGAFDIPPANVRVIVPPTGSGFGGKHAAELSIGAARLARAAGRPVRIVYTREEEFTQAYFRPMAVIDVKSGVDKTGKITAWSFTDLNAGSAALRSPYNVPNQSVSNQPADSPLPQGSYRALGATANNFARESHIDELAIRTGADPLEYRLRQLGDERLAAVLKAVAERAGWASRPRSAQGGKRHGRGFGIAAGLEKGGRVATFVEVEVHEDRSLEVIRIVTGFECGAIVHPSNLRSQVEGGTIMALGGALFEAIHFDNGRILNPRLSEYRVPRFHDVPRIDVILLDRKDLPSQGGGETPLIAVAPALSNAIFDATGVRLRSLPLAPNGTIP